MATNKPTIKMPEFLVFARIFIVGFIAAETFRIAFYLGSNFSRELNEVVLWAKVGGILATLALCLTYSVKRNAHVVAARMGRSFRIDLLVVATMGMWSNELVLPWLSKFHTAFKSADPHWTPAILIFLSVMLLSPLIQQYWPRLRKQTAQLYFIADEEVGNEKDDLLASKSHAKSFAETVLASGAHSGLVFGVDGPWGVGKTSFINLAQRYWEGATDKVIVCRFEPLRYASEPDLSDRLIRDLTAAIQSKVFAPEFRRLGHWTPSSDLSPRSRRPFTPQNDGRRQSSPWHSFLPLQEGLLAGWSPPEITTCAVLNEVAHARATVISTSCSCR